MKLIDANKPPVLNACNLACGLMAGDEATFKQGYSLENAVLAAVNYVRGEGYELTDADVDTVRSIVGESTA